MAVCKDHTFDRDPHCVRCGKTASAQCRQLRERADQYRAWASLFAVFALFALLLMGVMVYGMMRATHGPTAPWWLFITLPAAALGGVGVGRSLR